uniref:C2H2-type domain-containing protein n=1 Tax=Globodera pallida TaxID=36090 RepID=A0A183C1P4_GLOPA
MNFDFFFDFQQFPSLDQLEAHLAADHFGVLPYECEQCQFAKFPTEFAVIKHNEMDHGNRSYSFRCRITPEVKAKRRKVREFLMTLTVDDEISLTPIGAPPHLTRSQQQGVALLGREGKCHQQANLPTTAAAGRPTNSPNLSAKTMLLRRLSQISPILFRP